MPVSRRPWEILAATAMVVLSTALFFRTQIGDGFTHLFGDPNDGFIGISILQHWARVLQGAEPWNRPDYFYPYADTLGYNDGLLLFGLPYAAVRRLGVDPFLATEAVNVALRALGTAAFYVAARRVFALPVSLALLGGFLSGISGDAAVQGGHWQLFTIAFTPLAAWLLYEAAASLLMGARRAAALWGIAAAVLFDAWAMTAFYTVWFTALLFAIWAVFAGLQLAVARGLRARLRLRVADLWPVATTLLVAVAGAIPFALVYLPKAAETGMHDFHAARSYQPGIIDLLNPHLTGGLLAGWHHRMIERFSGGREMDPNGYAPLLIVLAAAGLLAVWRRPLTTAALIRRATALSTVVCIALVTQPDAWHAVFDYVPGARALRDIARFFLVLGVPVTLLALCGIDGLRRLLRLPPRGLGWLALLLLLPLTAEETTMRSWTGLDRPAALHLLAAIPPPPGGCAAFYTLGHSPEFAEPPSFIDALYRHNSDAMLIASMTGLPTINGFSTFNPPDWDFQNPDATDYRQRVAKYASAHGLVESLCALDLSNRRWQSHALLQPDQPAPLPTAALGATIMLGDENPLSSRYLLSGWSFPEPPGRWTDQPDATLRLLLPEAAATQALTLTLTMSALLPPDRPGHSRVRILANGQEIGAVEVGPTQQPFTVTLPPGVLGANHALVITLAQPPLRTPAELHVADDYRHLGLYVRSLLIRQAAAATTAP